jgi:hypothetical protein
VAYLCRELGVRLLSISWRFDDQEAALGLRADTERLWK